MSEQEFKYFQVGVGSWKILINLPLDTRILQEYEYRLVPGEFVKALHMGNPLIDLGVVLDEMVSKKSYGVLLPNLPGILVDEVVDSPDIDGEFSVSDKILKSNPGILIEKCAKVGHELIPILSLEKLFSVEFTVKIDEELSNRRWI